MNTLARGLLLGALHVALVAGIAAKFQIDRATLPRVWVRTLPVDPDSLTRGRYVSLRIIPDFAPDALTESHNVALPVVVLAVENHKLVAHAARDSGLYVNSGGTEPGLAEPIAFFIPEHAPDPSRRAPGEELWAEVTVPKKGPPRPIRLGVRKDGVLNPLPL